MSHDLSNLPRVDRVSRHESLDQVRSRLGERVVVELARAAIDEARHSVLAGEPVPEVAAVAARTLARANALVMSRARRVLNATGVMVHTNLGRAPLSDRAAREVTSTLRGACSIEIDLETGKRGSRGAFAEAALATLTEAEAGLVVNNCAAAVLLMLTALARGRCVIVSRGELVEIGGGFRVPEIMEASGCRLVEVGTTNKTRVEDYARALDANPDAVAILRVHQGNFRQIGFVHRPRPAELGALAKERGVMFLKDLGGGALVDFDPTGLVGEPTAASALHAGATVVTFSTDKVLGGPQGGAIVGTRAAVERMRRHPLARALRLGRLPMVALEATLSSYLEGRAFDEVPVLAMAFTPLDQVESRARVWALALEGVGVAAEVVRTKVEMGGGTLAGRDVPSAGVAIAPEGGAVDALAKRLRLGDPAVVARVEADRIVLDARTVAEGEDEALVRAVREAVHHEG